MNCAYYRCCFCIITYKLRLVMNCNELELWIPSLVTWNFIAVQSNRWMLIVNNYCAIFTNLYLVDSHDETDTWEGFEGIRLTEVSLYIWYLFVQRAKLLSDNLDRPEIWTVLDKKKKNKPFRLCGGSFASCEIKLGLSLICFVLYIILGLPVHARAFHRSAREMFLRGTSANSRILIFPMWQTFR